MFLSLFSDLQVVLVIIPTIAVALELGNHEFQLRLHSPDSLQFIASSRFRVCALAQARSHIQVHSRRTLSGHANPNCVSVEAQSLQGALSSIMSNV